MSAFCSEIAPPLLQRFNAFNASTRSAWLPLCRAGQIRRIRVAFILTVCHSCHGLSRLLSRLSLKESPTKCGLSRRHGLLPRYATPPAIRASCCRTTRRAPTNPNVRLSRPISTYLELSRVLQRSANIRNNPDQSEVIRSGKRFSPTKPPPAAVFAALDPLILKSINPEIHPTTPTSHHSSSTGIHESTNP